METESVDLLKWVLSGIGVILAAISSYIYFLHRIHQSERKETAAAAAAERERLSATSEKQFDTMVGMGKDTNTALNQNTVAITELTGTLGKVNGGDRR